MGLLSLVIPTFNEKPNIEPLLQEIDKALVGVTDYEVVFVDDSTDDTPSFLHDLSQKNGRVRYVHRKNGTGLASAVVMGFSLAKGDVIAVMDADLQHPPSLLSSMFQALGENNDIVLPSRYVSGGGSGGLSFTRMLASKSARLASRLFLKSMRNVTDPMSGYFMFQRSVIEGVPLNPLGWKILMEVLVLGKYQSVVEIPYGFEKRNAGESKLSFKVTAQYFMHIFSLVARSERDRRFFLFALVGMSGIIVDMAVFLALTSMFTLSINLAATVSAASAMISNFLLNTNMTWKNREKQRVDKEFSRYAVTNCIGIGIKNLFVYFLVRLGCSGVWSNLVGIMAACLWNYRMDSHWVFKLKDITVKLRRKG